MVVGLPCALAVAAAAQADVVADSVELADAAPGSQVAQVGALEPSCHTELLLRSAAAVVHFAVGCYHHTLLMSHALQ